MVFRHHLAPQDELDHNPTSKNDTSTSASSTSTSPPAVQTAPASSNPTPPASKTDAGSASSKPTAASTPPAEKSTATDASSKPTTSPSSLKQPQADSSPTPPPASTSPSTPAKTAPAAPAASSSGNSTKASNSSSEPAPPVAVIASSKSESSPPAAASPPAAESSSDSSAKASGTSKSAPVAAITSNKSQSSPSAAASPPPTAASPPPTATSANKTASSSTTSSSKSLSSAPFASNSTSSSTDGRILGISTTFLLHLGIALLIIAIIVIIIIILYRRYQTRQDYNDSPENFTHKPVLSFLEDYHLSHTKVEKCITPERIAIEEQNGLSGKLFKVEFKGTDKSAVFFHRRQTTTAYFEVEVLQANGSVEVGFLPYANYEKWKKGEENVGSSGVSVSNSGFVQAEGENIYNYSWILAFGDVFGIGLTKENSKFNERRAWISKNGVLLNYPPADEMDKWLATVDIPADEKQEYNMGIEKKEGQSEQGDKEDEQKVKEKAQRQKIEGLLRKQRISLKTFNKFEFYPVIICHGNKDETKSTVINVNVGGQIFRMYDAQFRSGLLKEKAVFGDD